MSLSPPSVRDHVVDGYRSRTAGGGRPDEVLDAHGAVRSGQETVASALEELGTAGLRAAAAETRRLVREEGIQYGAAGEDRRPRTWSLDPVPVVLGAHEWAALERGLEQRSVLLDLLLTDIYGPRRLLADGTLPADLVVGHPGFVPRADGLPARGERRLGVVAADLGRDAGGTWTVIGDRTAAPSGAGYAMANRRITSRVMAGLHRRTPLARLRGFFHAMTESLAELAPEGSETRRVVVLSPGSASETAFEQAFIATLMGFPLVEADDLSVRRRAGLAAGRRPPRARRRRPAPRRQRVLRPAGAARGLPARRPRPARGRTARHRGHREPPRVPGAGEPRPPRVPALALPAAAR